MQTTDDEISIHISVAAQTLEVRRPTGEPLRRYLISTSDFGLGTEPGSLRTPLGRFQIVDKIGDGAPLGMTFKSRLPTGEIGLDASDDDLILSRILWLDGLEEHNANTYDRYIYIHGTNHEARIGTTASHGCIRMRNADVIDLFDLSLVGTTVTISET